MAIEKHTREGFLVFRVRDALGLQSNIVELEEMIRQALEKGERRIAISFSPASHLYSNTISVLIRCISHAQDYDTKVTLVIPNEDIMHSVQLVGLIGLVDTCTSEEELQG